MNLIKDYREYIWALPFIAGILILISLVTPAFYASQYLVEEYYWMWGLFYASIRGYGSITSFFFNEEPLSFTLPIFLTGIIPFLIILVASIALLISANAVRTGKIDIIHRRNMWIVISIIMIIAPIIYIVGIDITMTNFAEYQFELIYGYVPPGIPDFWSVYDPGFAIIAPFIGAALSIAGSIASKRMGQREAPISIRKDQGGVITKTPIGQISPNIKFCSECGHQLLYAGANFCPNCGKSIKF